MTIDVEELHFGFTDIRPIQRDWSQGWAEDWDFTDADETEIAIADLPDLECKECGEPIRFIDGTLTHIKPPSDDDPVDTDAIADVELNENHDPELDLEDHVRFLSVRADHVVFLVAGSSPHVEVFDTEIFIGEGPMMNYWYRLTIDNPTEAALTLRANFLPLCVVEVDGETGLALTGGGMDLSWEICKAYCLLGYLPPLHFADLSAMADKRATADNLAVIAACKRVAEDAKARADHMVEKLTNLATKLLPPEPEKD